MTNSRRGAALAVLLTAEAMNLLDATIVQVAAPAIDADLRGGGSAIQWYSAAYTLPFAILLITGGRLGDLIGRKRIFQIGVAGFVVTSLWCALAGSAGLLITARALQGAAAALIIPQTIGLIRSMFANHELSKAFGWIGPVMGLSAVCGPLLGGVLTHADLFGSSWRAVFLVNLPLGVLVLAASPLLTEDKAAHRPRFDFAGTLLASVGTGLIVYPLIEGNPLWTIAGVAALVLFGLHQRRRSRQGRSPLVEMSLFRDHGFPAGLATALLFFAVVTGFTLVVALQVQLAEHRDVLAAGLTLVPWSVGAGVASVVSGRVLVPRFGSKVPFAGLAIMLAGLLGYALGAPALLVCGIGQGLFTSGFFTATLRRVGPAETGSAAGLLNAVQQLGGAVGIALLGNVFLTYGVTAACWVAGALLIGTVLTTVVLTRPAGSAPSRRLPEVQARR
ncbi:drug resistance transporter, EmrB/QacA subfamily [Amycolatopsis xylanica]|uniref:Drug resistance transporter, EmrB/QacA subfamily n=1 Tax=Amycolatopsis xylanica TaxID=589385 RepID=A0A1H3IRB1_9PSEU|nr:MFS transporter [Amycolatopsis xylanica]SDY30250.1 drug resistance transporter, EmrB/QacA subfamily [Amycolatopsis xylanica]